MSWLRHPATAQLQLVWKVLIYLVLMVVLIIGLALVLRSIWPSQLELAFVFSGAVIGAANLLATWFCVQRLEGQSIAAVGLGRDRPWARHLVIGLLAGSAAITLCWLTYLAAGWATIGLPDYELHLLWHFPALSLAMVGGAVAEELCCRGYPFQVLARWNLPLGLGFTGLLFVAPHLRAPGAGHPLAIVNLLLAHAIFAVAYLRTRSLWLPIGLHLGWNLTQGCIFGLPVSGAPRLSSLLTTGLQENLWTGHEFGPEGGLVATLVGGAALLGMLRWMPQRWPQPDLMREDWKQPPPSGDAATEPAE